MQHLHTSRAPFLFHTNLTPSPQPPAQPLWRSPGLSCHISSPYPNCRLDPPRPAGPSCRRLSSTVTDVVVLEPKALQSLVALKAFSQGLAVCCRGRVGIDRCEEQDTHFLGKSKECPPSSGQHHPAGGKITCQDHYPYSFSGSRGASAPCSPMSLLLRTSSSVVVVLRASATTCGSPVAENRNWCFSMVENSGQV